MGILSQQPQRPPMQRPPMQQGQQAMQRPPMPQGQQRPPMQRPQGQPPGGMQRPPMSKPPMQPGQQPMQKPQGQQKPPMEQGQENFDQFVTDAIDILHTPNTTDAMVRKIQNAKSKVEEIGKTAVQVIKGVEAKANKAGVQVNAKTAIHGLNIIVGEIITIAEASGMKKATDEQKYQSFSFALSRYLKDAFKAGKFSKEELVQAAQQMSQRKSGQSIIKNMGPEAAALRQQRPQQNPQGQQQAMPQSQPPPGAPMGQQQAMGMQRPPTQPMQRPPMQPGPQRPQGILSQGQRRM